MREITEDTWDDEIWGASERVPASPRANLFFYFGQKDHWVADHTRDALIHARAFRDERPDERKPRMIVDEEGIPHAFCISEVLRD